MHSLAGARAMISRSEAITKERRTTRMVSTCWKTIWTFIVIWKPPLKKDGLFWCLQIPMDGKETRLKYPWTIDSTFFDNVTCLQFLFLRSYYDKESKSSVIFRRRSVRWEWLTVFWFGFSVFLTLLIMCEQVNHRI